MQHGVVTRWNLEFMQISLTPIASYNSAITRFNLILEGIHFVLNNKAVQFQVRKKYNLLKKKLSIDQRFAITKHKTHVLRIHYWAKSYKVIQPDVPESCVATCIHKFLVTNIYTYNMFLNMVELDHMVVLTFASKTVSTCCFIVLKGQTLKDVLQIFKQLARQKIKFKMG